MRVVSPAAAALVHARDLACDNLIPVTDVWRPPPGFYGCCCCCLQAGAGARQLCAGAARGLHLQRGHRLLCC